MAALRRALQLTPESPDGWRMLADQLDVTGDPDGADQARARYLKAATRDPNLIEAAAALVANELPLADARLRAHLQGHPTDVAALRMLAEIAARLRRYQDAQQLLERCLELAPSFDMARYNYASVLMRQGNAAPALSQIQPLLAREPRQPAYRFLQAAILANLGDYAESIEVYERVLKEHPQQPKMWMSLGHSLRTAGRTAEAIEAYRRAISMEPTLGEAYWSLANLKTFRFGDAELTAVRALLERTDLDSDSRLHFEFTLGKALEDRALYEESFSALCKRQRAAPEAPSLQCAGHDRLRREEHGGVDARVLRRARRLPAPRPPTPSSSSVCRGPARHCSSRSSPATPWSRARWSCRSCRRSRATSRSARNARRTSPSPSAP